MGSLGNMDRSTPPAGAATTKASRKQRPAASTIAAKQPAGPATYLSEKHAEFTKQLMQVCHKPAEERTDADIRFIRDRLHERSPFFKLWPPQLQALLCRLAAPERFVRHQVVISQGACPIKLFFLMDGTASVCVRDSAGSGGSELQRMAMLEVGATFGETALLGAKRHPAFIVVESTEASALSVDAAALAALMMEQQPMQPQGRRRGMSAIEANANTAPLSPGRQKQPATPSAEALYRMIGQEPPGSAVMLDDAKQRAELLAVQARQLRIAAELERGALSAWMPSHTSSSSPATGGTTGTAGMATGTLHGGQNRSKYPANADLAGSCSPCTAGALQLPPKHFPTSSRSPDATPAEEMQIHQAARALPAVQAPLLQNLPQSTHTCCAQHQSMPDNSAAGAVLSGAASQQAATSAAVAPAVRRAGSTGAAAGVVVPPSDSTLRYRERHAAILKGAGLQ